MMLVQVLNLMQLHVVTLIMNTGLHLWMEELNAIIHPLAPLTVVLALVEVLVPVVAEVVQVAVLVNLRS
jgi:hypothetical protein